MHKKEECLYMLYICLFTRAAKLLGSMIRIVYKSYFGDGVATCLETITKISTFQRF